MPECQECKVTFKNYHNFGAHIRLYHIRKDENLEIPCEFCGKCYRNIHLLNNHCNIVHKVEENIRCNLCERPYQNIKKLKIHTMKCLIRHPQFEEYHKKEILAIAKRAEEENLSTPNLDKIKDKDNFKKHNQKTGKQEGSDNYTFDYQEAQKFMNYNKQTDFPFSELTKKEIKKETECSENDENSEKDKSSEDDENSGHENSENENSDAESSENDQYDFGLAHLVEPKLKNIKQDEDEKDDWNWIKLEEDSDVEEGSSSHNHFASNPGLQKKKKPNAGKRLKAPVIYLCPVCNDEVKDLEGHMTTEHPDAPPCYQCKKCPIVFDCKDKLAMHSCKDEPSLCDICSKVFKNSRILKQHIRQIHEKRPDEVKKPREPKICPTCGALVVFLKQHIRQVHEKALYQKPRQPKVCPICARQVVYLGVHIKEVHSDDGHFPCSVCGKIFGSRIKVNSHFTSAHRQEPSLCTVCSQVFKNPHALKGHMRTVHEEKSHQTCPICFQQFDTKTKLYGHNRIVHQKIRSGSVRCNPCGITFKNKSLLKNHLKESPWCSQQQTEYEKTQGNGGNPSQSM